VPEASATARHMLARPAIDAVAPSSFGVPLDAVSGLAAVLRGSVLVAGAVLALAGERGRAALARTWARPYPRTTPAVIGSVLLLVASVVHSFAAPAPGPTIEPTVAESSAAAALVADAVGTSIPLGARRVDPSAGAVGTRSAGPFLADGTLLKPALVDGSVLVGTVDRITVHVVRSGDTLTGIAERFGVSMMTLWWANDLASKDRLRVGQRLRIPPVNGVLYTVREGDSLETIARLTHGDVETIRAFNGLGYGAIVAGQLLMIPGGEGPPIPVTRTQAAPRAAAPAPTPLPEPIAVVSGVASWMYASGLAMRLPIGTPVRICGDGGCILRTVTTWGPSSTLSDRVADLSATDFTIVCGCALSVGLTYVRVEVLPD